ncbi:fusaric acid resistance protein FusB [Gluconobacter thailandicus F149-1 = NBRC 100600]|uniref:Fusaric acid resistance protein FusB n=1 Tax=Gluconobacter thailandicus NBRC 3257 TaxID=1381097 RepID=A0ABQ0IUX3_GLUTH|nr:FUSC family protein [Gluconobacter thailandicus]KXV52175.1 hypothetical protein AD946_14685 [Gluconobacter thailandicus]GAC86435.1 hypothetical protein NBRC3255_0096 [Gluconobacter thailandicus NBRC 3255]GAD25996.1 hypothetical protein NBRC3257_0995 [Gluconobacter thailandicus NBRC 3257]GAN93568.1 fusaric acid resistance protein FusB [Gluconobacter thailandicus F149-1 = NBRC 100600]GBR60026.1 fusaric acid resistance protein FusB [Gluconobacter thailandicus F149-1 = NBRC 100600]
MTAAFQSVFRPGWIQFSLRTWVALVLALATAFWAQVDTPAGAGVTVMILAQPLRGQALSKALYRFLGTLLGVGVSILLISMFSQDRGLFLGGVALWMAGCAFVGTLERDFRAYGALLAGYMVALVAVASVDAPQNIYHVSVARASTVAIGVASIAVVNLLSGSPQAWRNLAKGLQNLGHRIRGLSHSAIMGDPPSSAQGTTALASEILSLMTQISYARTELDRSRLRMAGAKLSIIGMLTVLTCSRAISVLLKEGGVTDILVRYVRQWHERVEDGTNRQETMGTILSNIRKEDPEYFPTPRDAWFLERAATLLSNRLHIRTGISTLMKATPAGEALKLATLSNNPDYITAFINSMRVLLGFSFVAAFCVGTGQPASATALSQCALVLVLASSSLDTAVFGKGAMIGTPLGILAAGFLSFWVLPYVYTLQGLAFVLLPQTVIACLLLMNPKTTAVGFHYGAFFLVFVGLGNHHSYDPAAFLERNTFYFLSAVLSFVLLVLLWPPTARRHRFRIAVAISSDLESQLGGHGEAMGPALLSRKYDRLSQLLLWTKRLPKGGTSSEHVFERLVALEDLSSTIARVRLYLDQAARMPSLRHLVRPARKALAQDSLALLESELADMTQEFLDRLRLGAPSEEILILNCVGGLEAVRVMLLRNRTAVHHYGIGRKRW